MERIITKAIVSSEYKKAMELLASIESTGAVVFEDSIEHAAACSVCAMFSNTLIVNRGVGVRMTAAAVFEMCNDPIVEINQNVKDAINGCAADLSDYAAAIHLANRLVNKIVGMVEDSVDLMDYNLDVPYHNAGFRYTLKR